MTIFKELGMSFYDHYYLTRTLCNVLEEMRKCHKTRNYSMLSSLIEEAQSMGNRMEAKLDTIKSFKALEEDHKKLRVEYKELHNKVEKLKEEN